MSKQQKLYANDAQDLSFIPNGVFEIQNTTERPPETLGALIRHWLIVTAVTVASLAAFGAGLKYLDEDTKRETARRNQMTTDQIKSESSLNCSDSSLPPDSAP